MITGVIKNKIDKIWTDIWAGGITNPLTVIEQLTYLMFIRSLDEKELETEEFAHTMGIEADEADLIFPKSATGQSMRWSKFKDKDAREIFDIIAQRVFPSVKKMTASCRTSTKTASSLKFQTVKKADRHRLLSPNTWIVLCS